MPVPSDIYFQTMADLHRDGLYVGKLSGRYARLKWWIDVFIAVAGSASIGAWAIWNKYPLIWGGIIAGSQVVTAIKPFIPYWKRAESLHQLRYDLESIFLEAERDWYKIFEGLIDPAKTNELNTKMKLARAAAIKARFPDSGVPDIEKIENWANNASAQYMSQFEEKDEVDER